MEITCYRDPEIGRETRYLPAKSYNLAITLLSKCVTRHLFVPIRSMQYMAIIDHDEFVFIDGERKCWIDIAWRDFKRHERDALDQPVAYQAVFYRAHSAGAADIMTRLQSEFPSALRVLADKAPIKGSAHIIPFRGSGKPAN